MSWSISACGPVTKVAEQLEQQFGRVNMNDKGEQETVQNVRRLVVQKGEQETVQSVRRLVLQTLGTIDPDKIVRVIASGSMGFKDWQTKTGPYQSVDLKIEPIHFS